MGCGASRVNPACVDISHFVEERVIGEGGFGMVKAVTKRAGSDAGTWYAMKVLKKSAIVERNQVGLTFAEMKLCRLLSSLRSPFLCNLAYAWTRPRKASGISAKKQSIAYGKLRSRPRK